MNTTLPFQPISVPELLREFRTRRSPTTFNAESAGPRAAFTTGIHVYFELNLTLRLAAAEDDKSAERYLELMAEFTSIGEGAARISQAQLLEVQADRLHFLLEDEHGAVRPSIATLQRLMSLSHAVINEAYHRLERKAGDAWQGCCGAADFGQAALLNSDVGGGSIVSLGNAANRPAKRLENVPAGALSVLDTILPRELGGGAASQWVDIDVRRPTAATLEFLNVEIRRQLDTYMSALPARSLNEFRVLRPNQTFFEAASGGGGISPTRLQGFCLRADLDGFSKQVAVAFAHGAEAVGDLVRRFQQVLEFPTAYERAIRARTITLPWAGDCSTILLLPPYGESMESSRLMLPVTAALEWHKAFGSDRKFSDSVGGARWALGIVAGDRDEGNDGHMLVAEIPALGRTFRIAAGWAAKRSSDAYQYPGVVGGDTVVTQVDKKHLWKPHAESFKDLGTLLARATGESLRNAEKERAKRAAISTAAASPLAVPVPSPRPYFSQ